MAGSIALSLSQQFDQNGRLLSGGKLYFYQANTTTPQNAFKDAGLTLPHPNPIVLDSKGRVPAFYLADGSIRVRLTDRSGVVQIDEPSLLVIGPSSGEGGSGPAIDPTTIFQTGDIIWNAVSGTRPGWVRANGRTLGNATSGASERANSDTSDLFAYLWQNFSDAHCPVLGGRGASSSADFAASKQITLPDMRGRAPFGLDDMGNTAANRFAGVPFTSGDDSKTAAGTGGESQHTLTVSELAVHSHGGNTGDDTPDHTHTTNINIGGSSQAQAGAGAGFFPISGTTNSVISGGANARHHHPINSDGGGAAHNNMPPFMLGSFYIKL